VKPDTQSCGPGELCQLTPGSDDCKPGVICVNGVCQQTLDSGCVVGGSKHNCGIGEL
ncbi:15276_t:CDS:1, partial [Racocetra fulgida]